MNGAVNALVSLRDPDALMAEARALDDVPRLRAGCMEFPLR